jgi:hypothetical protein
MGEFWLWTWRIADASGPDEVVQPEQPGAFVSLRALPRDFTLVLCLPQLTLGVLIQRHSLKWIWLLGWAIEFGQAVVLSQWY